MSEPSDRPDASRAFSRQPRVSAGDGGVPVDEASPGGGPPEGAEGARPKGLSGWLRHLFLEGPSFGQILRDAYLTFDRRTLGFSRILLGFLLIMDLFRRTPDWMSMFATTGVLPVPLNLSRPQAPAAFSIVNAFVTPPELIGLWILIFVTYVCVLVGFKTRLAQVLTVFWVTGLNGRVLLIENGGYVVFNLLAMWTAFLPMGDRFSVDAFRASMRRKRELDAAALNDRGDLIPTERLAPHVTFVSLAILLQLSVIYFFNVVHKYGPGWRREYSAVHYVLWVDRMVTPVVSAVRTSIPFWFSLALTKLVLAMEAALPFCLLSPLAKRWARLAAAVLILVLHIGFGSSFVLGPFAWALCVFSTLLYGREDWDDVARTMRRPHRARTVLFDPASAGALYLARALARLDRYELLTFEEAPGLPAGLAVRGLDGAQRGGAGFAQIVAALPLGPTVAWLFRAPLVKTPLDAAVRLFESGAVARFFRVEHAGARAPEPLPSPARRTWRKGLGVLRELAILAMFAGAVNQALTELWSTRDRWSRLVADLNTSDTVKELGWHLSPQPEPMRVLAHKLRFLQGWFMFSPNPVMDDGTVVVDAITADGRHIDPLTGRPPDFDLPNATSYGYNQIWSDYRNRIRMPGNAAYREAMREFLLRFPDRTGRPEDGLVSGDVYWLEEQNPRFGDPARKGHHFKQTKLFSFDRERIVTTPQARNEPAAPR